MHAHGAVSLSYKQCSSKSGVLRVANGPFLPKGCLGSFNKRILREIKAILVNFEVYYHKR